MPHISLAMQNEGDVCVCNLNTQSLETGTKEKIFLHQHGLEAAWNSPTRKMIAAGLDRGHRLAGCRACWDMEDAGVTSARQHRNRELASIEPDTNQPKILIIKPGNVCNLGCRTCNPATSTSLYQDFYQLDTQRNQYSGSFKDYTNRFESIRTGFNINNDKIWPVLEQWYEKLTFIDIYGGEPMLATALWDSLKFAVSGGYSNNIDLQLHTNITVWSEEYLNILRQFKSASIGLSIDSNNAVELEYIRHKSNSSQILANLEKYKQFVTDNKNIHCHITFTVSIYNIFDIDRILDNLNTYGFRVAVNFVHDPQHYDIRHLPKSIKEILYAKTVNSQAKKLLKQTIPGCDIHWPKFCQELALLDKIRNQKFAEVFPEWFKLLEPYLNGQTV